MKRLAAALVLALFLSGELLCGGWGVLGGVGTILFPYLWFYLVIESLSEKGRIKDGQLFLLAGSFSFLYEGIFTKRMQSGLSVTGLDWAAILSGPFEWGMIAVVWFHCLEALVPRRKDVERSFWRRAAIVLIFVGAVLVYLWKTTYGHYRIQNMLGPLWLLDDILLAGAAWGMWRLFRKSSAESFEQRPLWIWGLAGVGLWISGAGLLAQIYSGYPSSLLASALQGLWLGGVAWLLRSCWQRRGLSAETVRRSRPIFVAAGFRVVGILLLLLIFGTDWDMRKVFWSGVLCRLPALVFFYSAFLTSRLEV